MTLIPCVTRTVFGSRAIIATALKSFALVVLTLPLCAWFSVHSTPFAEVLRLTLDREGRPGALTFGHLEWGPGLYEISLYDVVMVDRDGEPILEAGRVHAVADRDRLAVGDRKLHLALGQVEIDDFELTLEWDKRVGRLGLVDIFKQRAFAIAREKAPDFDFELDLQGIQLRRGRLHLVWSGFGFSFDAIDTAGTVGWTKDGGLSIDVPALDSLAGTAWVRRAPAALQLAVETEMPGNPIADTVPEERLRIPYASVVIRDFEWTGDGFAVDLRIAGGTGNVPIHAWGSMSFPKDAGIQHSLGLEATLPAALVEKVSRGAVTGETTLRLASEEGNDLAGRFTIGPMQVSALELGEKGTVTDLELRALQLDTLGEEGSVRLDAHAGKVAIAGYGAEDIGLAVEARVGYDGWEVHDFLGHMLAPPDTALGWLGVFPAGSTRAAVSVAKAGAQKVRRGELTMEQVGIDDLTVEVALPKLTARLGRADLGDGAWVSGTGTVELDIGLTSIGLDTNATLELHDVPKSILRRVFPDHAALGDDAPDRLDASYTVKGDLTEPEAIGAALVVGGPPP